MYHSYTDDQLCLGCQDSSKYSGSINWLPVISQTYWSVSMTGMSALSSRKNSLKDSLIGVSLFLLFFKPTLTNRPSTPERPSSTSPPPSPTDSTPRSQEPLPPLISSERDSTSSHARPAPSSRSALPVNPLVSTWQISTLVKSLLADQCVLVVSSVSDRDSQTTSLLSVMPS